VLEGHPSIEVRDRRKINVLGLIMEDIISRALKKDRGRRILHHLRGFLLISASQMRVFVGFLPGKVIIAHGWDEGGSVRGRVSGTLSSLSEMKSLGRLILGLVRGEIGVGGNPIFLLLSFLMIREGIR